MFDRRIKNIEIFQDTTKLINENTRLNEAVAYSRNNQKLYLEKNSAGADITDRKFVNTNIIVSRKRSFEAASQYAREGKKVCVLNFASATNPGGGVTHGSSAQEEALCRCSTLYPCLNTNEFWEDFYREHRKENNPLYNADCIYTPGVVVFKSDVSFPERMREDEWYTVDVLTCAAPNLRRYPSNVMNPNAGSQAAEISLDELVKLLEKRIERIFAIANEWKAEVLILGAFGCGAFCNPPEIVAGEFAKVQEKYRGCFETIEYAIYCRDYESANYDEFCKVDRKPELS